jgi:signal transduction histidine kinase
VAVWRWLGRGRRAEAALIAFVGLCLIAMLAIHAWWAPVPFHFAYTAVTIVYGLRLWQTRGVIWAAVLLGASTFMITLFNVVTGGEPGAELVEVPLMLLMFLATAWHVRSRQAANAVVAAVAEERADMIERERAFFANVSHDLMTPLTVARGHLDVFGRYRHPSDEEIAEMKRIVVEELRRIEAMVGDLLIVGRLDAESRLDRHPTDAQELLEGVAERWTSVGDRRWGVEIDARGLLLCDPGSLAKALDNVIENAVSYTSPGASIAITAHGQPDLLEVVVTDNGPGIPAEALPHVFDRFYRADRSRSRQTGGTGLGLAIVRDVVEAHDGVVTAERGRDGGTRIAIRLPGFTPSRVQPLRRTG